MDGPVTSTGPIEPDTKDWTWVLERPCPDCGFDAAVIAVEQIPALVRATTATWTTVLALPDAADRPAAATWSPLEYACHIRDVHRIFDLRVGLMLAEDDPEFPNWDQDETAVAERYAEQDPATVAAELAAAAESVSRRYESVPAGAWSRRGLRSNGSAFTIDSIGRYHLHDLLHHGWDVRSAVARATVAAYDRHAEDYRAGTQPVSEQTRLHLTDFLAALPEPRSARVLEIGSGPGRDALWLERAGVSVRRTDVSPRFVELLRADRHEADLLDPLHDDLTDPARPSMAYDGVWASACLLHVDRGDLPSVLARLGAATRPGGALGLSVKEGDGEAWTSQGLVGAPRHLVYWRADPLRATVESAGWTVLSLERRVSERSGETWLDLIARREDLGS